MIELFEVLAVPLIVIWVIWLINRKLDAAITREALKIKVGDTLVDYTELHEKLAVLVNNGRGGSPKADSLRIRIKKQVKLGY